jgi:hypothetical protein
MVTAMRTSSSIGLMKYCELSTARCVRLCTAWRTLAGSHPYRGTSENNRKARYYRLTPKGRKQLIRQTGRWEQLVRAINPVLKPAME